MIPVVDPGVPQEDHSRLNKMSKAVLQKLTAGPTTNSEFAQMFHPGAAWRTRVSDVRHYLLRFGMTVKTESLGGGLWLYSIVLVLGPVNIRERTDA